MAITFLQAVNAVLRRVGEIAGDSQELGTSTVTSTATGAVATDAFVDSRRQHKIDIVLQLFNEVQAEILRHGLFGQTIASATLILLEGQREYDLPADFDRLAGPDTARAARGATTGLLMFEYKGGYAQMLVDQPTASDYVGTPSYFAISPVASKIRVDREPGGSENLAVYNYLYHKRYVLTSTMATSTFPFSDSVADNMIPIVCEAYNSIMKKDYNPGFVEAAVARTMEFLTQTTPRDRYGPRRAR